MSGGQAAGPQVHFNIDARGAQPGVEAMIRAALAQAAPGIVAAAVQTSQQQANRGGSYAKAMGRRA
jgi:hypothetical protein